MQAVANDAKNDPAFKHSMKRFFQNEVSDTASQYNAAANKFFDGGHQGKVTAENTIGGKFTGVQDRIVPNKMDGERYQVDLARFHGEEAEVRSQGSVFQANKQVFFTGEKPMPGFKIEKGP